MTLTPEELRSRLDAELAPLPVTPRMPYPEITARAHRRRTRRRAAYASAGVALLTAAAVVISLLVVSRPAPPASLQPTRPSPTVPVARPALAGDVDGDGQADSVSLTATDLVLVGTRVGRLALPLPPALQNVSIAGTRMTDHPATGFVGATGPDITGDGFAEIVLTASPVAAPTSSATGTTVTRTSDYLVQLVDPVSAHPHLALVSTAGGAPLALARVSDAPVSASWTCVSPAGVLNSPGLLTTRTLTATTETDDTYALSAGVAVLQKSVTTPHPFTGASSPGAEEDEDGCTSAGTVPSTSTAGTPTTGTGTGTGTGIGIGIDGEQFGSGTIPNGSGTATIYPASTLVRRSLDGFSVLVPASWIGVSQTVPSDHTDLLFYDPNNPTARLEIVQSACASCVTGTQNDRTANLTPALPAATTTTTPLHNAQAIAFSERPWLGYAVDGVVTATRGASDTITGYVLDRVALTPDQHALATTILNSFAVSPGGANTSSNASPTTATNGDLDGDGTPDAVSLTGGTPEAAPYQNTLDHPTLVVQSSRYGRLTLPLDQDRLDLAHRGGKPYADVDLFADGQAEVTLVVDNGGTIQIEFVRVVDGKLVLLTGANGQPFSMQEGGMANAPWLWTCRSATGVTNQPGELLQGFIEPPTGGRVEVTETTYGLDGSTVVQMSSQTTSEPYVATAPASITASFDACGTGT
jgi:hypothetical protein